MDIGIIGLGKFGMQLGSSLMALGHTCLGLDINQTKAQQAREVFSHVYAGDAANQETLQELGFHNLDTVAVTIGNHMEASILAVLALQELGAAQILVKASNAMHKKVLQRLGVTTIVQPEIDEAKRLALKLDTPGIIDLLPIGPGVAVQEAQVEDWAGKSLRELNVRSASNVLVAAVKEKGSENYRFVPDPGRKFEPGDKVLLIGYGDDMKKALKKI